MSKALSLLQPWLWWVLHGGKTIENRVPSSSAHKAMRRYRGPLYLHASAGVGSALEFSMACEWIERVARATPAGEIAWEQFRDEHLELAMRRGRAVFLPRASLLRGGIIGRCRVAGLIQPNGEPYGLEGQIALRKYAVDRRWHIPGQWGHILIDVEPLPFQPCKGALGLWDHVPGVSDEEWRRRLDGVTVSHPVVRPGMSEQSKQAVLAVVEAAANMLRDGDLPTRPPHFGTEFDVEDPPEAPAVESLDEVPDA